MGNNGETLEFSPQLLASPVWQDMQTRIRRMQAYPGGLLRGEVPLSLISNSEVPVNVQNLDTITYQLADEAEKKGGSGQIQPVMLGALAVRKSLEIIDGFHRYTVFKERNAYDIYGTIVEVSEEELYDKRIQNTNNHAGLQFSRAVDWVRAAWSLHPLSEKVPSASTAFVIGRVRSSNGRGLGLTKEEFQEIMDWADSKAKLWGVSPTTIYKYLHTDDHVHPLLVAESRRDIGQSGSEVSLPHATVSKISQMIPGRFDLHLQVATAINKHRLGGAGTSALLRDIKRMSDKDAAQYLQTFKPSAYKEKIAANPGFTFKDDDIVRLEQVRGSSRVAPLEQIAGATTLKLLAAAEEKDFRPERMNGALDEVEAVANGLLETVANIRQQLGQETNEKPVAERRKTQDFANLLAEFLVSNEPGELTILNMREATVVRNAISRGRGTDQALVKLAAIYLDYEKRSNG